MFQKFLIKHNAKGIEKAIYIHDMKLNHEWVKYECNWILNGAGIGEEEE